MYLINKVKNFLPYDALRLLYFSLIHSKLILGNMLWSATFQYNVKKIINIQNKCIKSIFQNQHGRDLSDLYYRAKILPFNELKKMETLKFMFDVIHKNLSQPLTNAFSSNANIHAHETRHAHDPRFRQFKYSLTKISFLHQGPLLWGKLPDRYKSIHGRNAFCNQVKKYLLNQLNN